MTSSGLSFARMAPVLRRKAKLVGENFFKEEEMAEDVAQEAVIRVWKAWDTLSSPEEAERLVVRVAKYECINVWRREQRRPHIALTANREVSHPASEEYSSLEESELMEAIRRAAGTLTRGEQRLWRMFAEAGMKPSEIAMVAEVNVRTVSAVLSHARHHIYKRLKEGGFIDG